MKNEGEKRDKVYTRGDVVTFRLPKKLRYSDDVIEFVNMAKNEEIIRAIEFYCKYKSAEPLIEKLFYKISLEDNNIIEEAQNMTKKSITVKEENNVEANANTNTDIVPLESIPGEMSSVKEQPNIIKVDKWNVQAEDEGAAELFDDPAPKEKGVSPMLKAYLSMKK